jgi:glycosyltransferase involved in cell wall biosynthesis
VRQVGPRRYIELLRRSSSIACSGGEIIPARSGTRRRMPAPRRREALLSGEFVRVAAYTGGLNVPSARFRVRQLIPHLATRGIEVRELALRCGKYPPVSRLSRPAWGCAVVAESMLRVGQGYRCDLTFLQRELVSRLRTFELFTRSPRVFDVDDAIWVLGEGMAASIARGSALVICGNDFLADRFSRWNPRVMVIPTAVDTDRFCPRPATDSGRILMGWSGTASGLKYLYGIEDALHQAMMGMPELQLRVVCDHAPRFTRLPLSRVEFVPWSPAVEAPAIQDLSIGLMPLEDSEWSRGKCAFKMLTYMACGLPVVVSPVGMNQTVLQMGTVGYAARSTTEWVDAILELSAREQTRNEMGRNGRRLAVDHFSIPVIGEQLANALKSVES